GTRGARIRDDRAGAAAGPARLLHPEEALALNHHAVAVAAAAGRWPGAALATAARTLRTQFLPRDRDGLGDAAVRLGQVEIALDAPVPAALRAAPAALAKDVAEQVAEQVEDGLGVVEVGDVEAFEAGVPVAVVALPLVRVAEHLVGLGGL